SRPASPPRPADQCCTYPPTGIGEPDGRPCGTTSSVTRSRNPAPPDPTFQALSAPPSQARPKEPKGKLVQASGSPTPHRATLGRIPKQPRRRQHEITHPRTQAKSQPDVKKRYYPPVDGLSLNPWMVPVI